jgi:lysyl-tRNA synthetase class 2
MSEERSIREIRLEKLQKLRDLGFDPYSVERFEFKHSPQELLDRYDELQGETVRIAGRLVSLRIMGKAAFAHISDGDGLAAFKLLDIGDHVGIEGELFLTRTEEKSVMVKSMTPLSKSLHNLPLGKEKDGETWNELKDTEQRYRHRHLDLIINHDVRKSLLDRSRIVSSVRRFFDNRGYLEVETPLLQLEAGGAAARPFLTHYNAYELDVKMRISLELYLKRIICGDVPKVYEIGRVFRNEGVSNRHNPEFTLLEFYEAYSNLEDMMAVVEDCFKHVAEEVFETTSLNGLEFGKPWKRVDLLTEIEKATGLTADDLSSIENAKAALGSREVMNPSNGKRIHAGDENNLGGLIEKLLEVFVEPNLQEPTFVVGYPIETSPLAKKDPNRPGFTRRFEGYVLGREICNAFSEINDPIDQRERFDQQLGEREKGDEEAHPMDEDFIYALESGMPPTGGVGIGIDRMAMLLTGADHLREILLFPMMKPEHNQANQDDED